MNDPSSNDSSSDQSGQTEYDPYITQQEPSGTEQAPQLSGTPPTYPPFPPQGPGFPTPPTGTANGLGTAALVLGISGAVVGWVPVLGCLGWVACILAIVFGVIGITRANSGRATNNRAAMAGLGLGIAGLVLGVIAAATLELEVASIEGEDPRTETTLAETGPENSEEDADDTAEADGAESADESAGVGDGIWEVGSEVEPGTYVTTVPDTGVVNSCYVARLSGFSGEFDELIANDNLSEGARGRVTISENDAGVEFTGGCEWEAASESNAVELGDSAGDGVWEVGSEIQPGTYVTQAEGEGAVDSCYVARLSGFSMDIDEIIANNNIDAGAQGRITIEDSDAGVKFSGGCTWSRD